MELELEQQLAAYVLVEATRSTDTATTEEWTGAGAVTRTFTDS